MVIPSSRGIRHTATPPPNICTVLAPRSSQPQRSACADCYVGGLDYVGEHIEGSTTSLAITMPDSRFALPGRWTPEVGALLKVVRSRTLTPTTSPKPKLTPSPGSSPRP